MRSMLASRSFRVVSFTCVLLLIAFALVCADLFSRYDRYQSEIDRMIPRIERFKGLVVSKEQLQQAAGSSAATVNQAIFPAATADASAAAELQRIVRDMLQQSGASVTGSQTLPSTVDGSFVHIKVDVTAVSGLAELEQFLQQLKGQNPAVFLESLTLQPVRARRGAPEAQAVTARMRVFALKGGA